ncbi:MAG: DUF2855 family protein [Pseudomonadota bacterium]
MHAKDLIVNRANLSETEVQTSPVPEPATGEALIRIDRFALTANNITYAVAPDQIGYWRFFPAQREGWGRVPVWGFGDVVASRCDLAEGTRLYGYFPMSSHLIVQPGKIRPHGFTDAAPHRQEMAKIYNQYADMTADPAYTPDREGVIALFRPLFTTSFLLDDMLRRADMFGAAQVVLSSASSKTALGLAFLLHRAGVRTVGLTSPGNVAFCKTLGVYDAVTTYDAVASMARDKTAFVDMAGSAELLRTVHAHFADALVTSCRVGLTHWQDTANRVDGLEGGPKPYFFFAPTYAEERIAEWGPAGLQARLAEAWGAFIAGADDWLRVVEETGPEAVQSRYARMLAGQMDPAEGYLLSIG